MILAIRQSLWLVALLLPIAFLAAPLRGDAAGAGDLLSLLEKKYGMVNPAANPQVARAHQVFARVQDVADKRANRMPQLTVVNKAEQPWAFSLPDGHILLSLGAIQLCYRHISQTEGDARLAFVFGHELAHLSKNDFWDQEMLHSLSKEENDGIRANHKPQKTEKGHETSTPTPYGNKEREADDLGFLYAGIAGYAVHTLLDHSDDQRHENFFAAWGESPHGGGVAGQHPAATEREAFLRDRLERLAEGIPFFRFAVRLAHFAECEQAIQLFRHFLQIFPSREVYNNLGACHLQRAQRQMNSTAAVASYWLPLLLDGHSRAEGLIGGYPRQVREEGGRLPSVLPDKEGREVEQAIDYLEQAAGMDASYMPARLNLATAYFYRGELLKARLVLQEVERIQPGQADVQGWQGLMAFLDSEAQGLAAAALPPLQRKAMQKEASLSLLFNQAILQRKLGRESRGWWNRLAARKEPLPPRYARIACAAARLHCLAAAKEKHPLWRLPLAPGQDLDAADRRKLFAGWHATSLGWLPGKKQGTAYRHGDEAEVLDLDGYAAMVVLRDGRLGSAAALRNKLGPPLQVRPLADEMAVWSYGENWAVLVRNGLVMEVWVSTPSAR
ncbi:MAG: M48 family metalloprotease [Magnetococcales bacterium]|nr:M48 family metalloprotease [Magnetococcales bacterium]